MMKKRNNKPFFSRFLETQKTLDKNTMKKIKAGDGIGQTQKFPSDSDEA